MNIVLRDAVQNKLLPAHQCLQCLGLHKICLVVEIRNPKAPSETLLYTFGLIYRSINYPKCGCTSLFPGAYFATFFLDLLKEVESSLRTNRDCLASLKCRTPCQNRHDYRLNHPQGRQDQKQHE